jgi:ABC-type transporter Mla subunit MlaD
MPNTVEVVDLRQRVPDDAPLAEPGRKALVEERQARKQAERAVKQLTARVEALEGRKGPDLDQLLSGIAAIRAEMRGDAGRLRAELVELAEALDQLRGMLQQG